MTHFRHKTYQTITVIISDLTHLTVWRQIVAYGKERQPQDNQHIDKDLLGQAHQSPAGKVAIPKGCQLVLAVRVCYELNIDKD